MPGGRDVGGRDVGDRDRVNREVASPRWLRAEMAVGALVVAYVVARIVLLDITNDELGALQDVYRRSFLECLSFAYVDAQNHFLTGLLSMVALRTLPFDEVISIRLPTLIGLALYLVGTWRLSRHFEDRRLGFALFLALQANAFVLDFFGLSRGYGLAMGLMAISLAALGELVRADGPVDGAGPLAHVAVLFAVLTVLAHLAFLNYFLGLVAVLAWPAIGAMSEAWRDSDRLWRRWGETLRRHAHLLYASGLLAAFYVDRVIFLMAKDGLYFGGDRGFLLDTVGTLVERTLYDLAPPAPLVTALALLAAAAYAAALYAARWLARPGPAARLAVALGAAVAVMVVYAVALHAVVGIKFVQQRAAMMFIPLFLAQLGATAAAVGGRWLRVAVAVLTAYSLLGLSQLNLTHTVAWPVNAEIRDVVRDLGEVPRTPGQEIVVAVTDDFKSTLWFYIPRLLGLEVDPKFRDNYFLRDFGSLAVYSPTHGRAEDDKVFV
ncbi:MAG: hypothetical protein AAFX50_08530, partial [Acidobacteriota bacterium]